MRRWDNRSGFTLLELLMVVIIIAILASIAMPQYIRVVERSRVAQVLQLMASVRGSEMRWKAQEGLGLAYTNNVALLDLAPLPVSPAGWGPVTSDADNVNAVRTGGATLSLDIATGTVCASTAVAQADWGVNAPGC